MHWVFLQHIIVSGICPNELTCRFNLDCRGTGTQLDVTLDANMPYFFLVTSTSPGATGTYSLSVSEITTPNDLCSGATVITTLPYSVVGSTSIGTQDYTCTSGSSTESSSGVDVWYTFTPTTNYPSIVISACDSRVRTTLYLSSGSCKGRQCIQSDSSSCTSSVSQSGRIQAPLQARTTYYIAAATATRGNFTLNIGIPPANDQCEGALEITSLPYRFEGSTTFARWDFTCPANVQQARDIYFRFTPNTDYTDVAINLCESNYDTVVYLASGSSCESLQCLDYNDHSNSNGCGLSFQSYLTAPLLSAGTTYYIIVSGFCNASGCKYGSVNLLITGSSPQSCAQPKIIDSIPYTFSGSLAASGDAFICANDEVPVSSAGGNYWFKFTPTQTFDHVFIGTCPVSFNSALFLATGSCDSLQCLSVSDAGYEYCSAQESRGALIADVSLRAEVEYFFAVTGITASDLGTFTFTISIDSSASLTILSPAANAVLGGESLSNLRISGKAGSFDARGTVILTIRDTSAATSDVIASTVVDVASNWVTGVNLLGLEDGWITVDAGLQDLSGNIATTSITFTKDTTTFVFVSVPAPSSIVNSASTSSVIVAGTGEPEGSVVVTLMDGDSLTPNVVSPTVIVGIDGTWSVTVSIAGLKDGIIRITASIRDPVGNSARSPTVSINKDTTTTVSILAPTSFQFVISQARAPSVTISGFADPGTNVVVQISDQDASTWDVMSRSVQASPVGTWSVIVDVSSLSDGNIFIIATATDSANNVAQSQTITMKKDALVFPTTIITTPPNGARVSGSQVTALVISGSGEAGGRVSLKITGTKGIISRSVTVSASGSWTTTVNISTLPNGLVNIGGTTNDGAGNSGSISAVSITKA